MGEKDAQEERGDVLRRPNAERRVVYDAARQSGANPLCGLVGGPAAGGVSVAKASEPRFDLRTTKTIRLSRPGVFRSTGEVLVKDKQEGRARTSTTETVQESAGEEELDRRTRALNAAMRLGHTKMSATGTTRAARTKTAAATVTHGKDGLIYCTSLWPGPHEENAWRRTFPDSYTSVARIYRPTQFAQALGFEVCEHIGAAGKPAPTRATFHGFRTVEVERTSQIVLHGPVVYVEDLLGANSYSMAQLVLNRNSYPTGRTAVQRRRLPTFEPRPLRGAGTALRMSKQSGICRFVPPRWFVQ